MDPRVLEIALVVGAVGLWAACYAALFLVTRPASPRPGPATQELGTESPAVASLLANRWAVTEDAVEATLLDLAARRHVELRQPAADPMQTTVHLRPEADQSGLTAYERRVLDRVGALAVGGVVPVTALTFRDDKQAKRWTKQVRVEIVAEARTKGLSQRRFGKTAVGLLVAAAGVVATVVATAAIHYNQRVVDEDEAGLVIFAFFFTFIALSAIAGRYPGERDTLDGRVVAARWLGVRDWLRGHEEFADLPPAAATVWDRYLAYGAALGVTRVASSVLDLGMGSRRLVWSSYGGTWHRVRVRYPRFWPKYGRKAFDLITRALLSIGLGLVLVLYGTKPRQILSDAAPARWFDTFEPLARIAGIALLAYGGYKLLRAVIDLATERTITGEVLWVQVWRTARKDDDARPEPVLHYLAVDDGAGDRTTAWALPSELAFCNDGDTVTLRVRRWTRRVLTLKVDERSKRGDFTESTVDHESEDLVATTLGSTMRAVTGVLRAPDVSPATLLTAEEVGHALGMAVRMQDEVPVPGPFRMVTFHTVERNKQVLLLQLAGGRMGAWAWRSNSRGTPLPGIGDGAFANGDRATLRFGETTVVLTLLGKGKGHRQHLPWLLTQAAGRMSA